MSQIKKRVSAGVFAPNRLEFLTDGVFAIVMTLLVLEITLPEIAYPSLQTELPQKLLEIWPKLFKYTLSFLVLGILWGFHHLAFHSIKRSNMALVWLNIVFLMFVTLIPFSTSFRPVPPITPSLVSTLIYVLNIALAFAMILIMWTYATGEHRLVDSDISPRLVKVYKFILIGLLLYSMLVIGISFIKVDISNHLFILVAVASIVLLLIMPGRLYQKPSDGEARE
jgi:uncharacterized membrane protein